MCQSSSSARGGQRRKLELDLFGFRGPWELESGASARTTNVLTQ